MNGYGHFVARAGAGSTSTGRFAAALLVVVAHLLWVRGTRGGLAHAAAAGARGASAARCALAAAVARCGFVAVGGWIFYNTNVLNEYVPDDVARDRQARYEKKYKQYESLPQPRIRAMSADVDIYPERRAVDIRGRYRLRQQDAAPIAELHVHIDPRRRDPIDRDRRPRTAATDDRELGYYDLPRWPSRSRPARTLRVALRQSRCATRGFGNGGRGHAAWSRNGTFFNSFDYFPHLGYDARSASSRTATSAQARPARRSSACRTSTTTRRAATTTSPATPTGSTSRPRSAPAPTRSRSRPGYLQREWTENGRRYFHYKMDRADPAASSPTCRRAGR